MQDIINEDEKDTVKKLLNEERDHIRRLSAFVEKTALI
jgi:rubrerythrin